MAMTALVHPSKKRSRIDNEPAFKALLEIGSYGIVSNGSEWIFNKLFVCDDVNSKSMVFTSNKYCITLADPTLEEIKKVLGRICYIINQRIADANKVEIYKRMKLSRDQIEAIENRMVNNFEANQMEEDEDELNEDEDEDEDED